MQKTTQIQKLIKNELRYLHYYIFSKHFYPKHGVSDDTASGQFSGFSILPCSLCIMHLCHKTNNLHLFWYSIIYSGSSEVIHLFIQTCGFVPHFYAVLHNIIGTLIQEVQLHTYCISHLNSKQENTLQALPLLFLI